MSELADFSVVPPTSNIISQAEELSISILPLVDNDNVPIICIIKPNGKGVYESEFVNSNFMLSIYGKDKQFEIYLNNSINHKNILYWNKKNSQELFRLWGYQLPQNLNRLDSGIILHKSKAFVISNVVDTPPKIAGRYT